MGRKLIGVKWVFKKYEPDFSIRYKLEYPCSDKRLHKNTLGQLHRKVFSCSPTHLSQLKEEFGVVEDGELRKLLGVRYTWKDMMIPNKAIVILPIDNKAEEIMRSFVKATGRTPKKL